MLVSWRVAPPPCSASMNYCWESSHSWESLFLFCRTNKQPFGKFHGFPTLNFSLRSPKKYLIQTSCGRSALNSPSRPTFPPDPDLDVRPMLRPTTWTCGSQPQIFWGGKIAAFFGASKRPFFLGEGNQNRIVSKRNLRGWVYDELCHFAGGDGCNKKCSTSFSYQRRPGLDWKQKCSQKIMSKLMEHGSKQKACLELIQQQIILPACSPSL